MKIAVADDMSIDREQIRELLKRWQKESGISLEVQYFEDGENLWHEVDTGERFDVYLLDAKMPKMDGVETAKRLRACDPEAYLVFITSYLQYAPSASEYGIFRYIDKLNIEEKLPQALTSIRQDRERKDRQRAYYCITEGPHWERIPCDEILYLYKEGKNTVIVKPDGKRKVRKALKIVYEELNSPNFFYVEKGYIVNLLHVMKLEAGKIYLRSGEYLPLGRERAKEVKKRILEFWGE